MLEKKVHGPHQSKVRAPRSSPWLELGHWVKLGQLGRAGSLIGPLTTWIDDIVYLYKGGALTKYLPQTTLGLYCTSAHTSLPNTMSSIQVMSQGSVVMVSFPPLGKLKRVHFQALTDSNSMARIFSFMLPLLLDPTPPHSLEESG